MAIENTDSLNSSLPDNHHRLHFLLDEINHHLDPTERTFYLIIRRAYYFKCCRSWAYVSTHLQKFMYNPNYYSLLMNVIDNEMLKFPAYTFYGSHLKLLSELLASGARFEQSLQTIDNNKSQKP